MTDPAMVEWARAHIVALDVEHYGGVGRPCVEDQPLAIATAYAGRADRGRTCLPKVVTGFGIKTCVKTKS
jgi:hypothetical protein